MKYVGKSTMFGATHIFQKRVKFVNFQTGKNRHYREFFMKFSSQNFPSKSSDRFRTTERFLMLQEVQQLCTGGGGSGASFSRGEAKN